MTVDTLGPEGFGTYQVDWGAGEPQFTRVSRPPERLLIPGFVDIHFHGAFGVDCLTTDEAGMATLIARLEAEGYEGVLPTTVTTDSATVLRFLHILPDHPLILGFHLEGPFISPKYPGAQPPEFILDPPEGPSEWDLILENPRLKVVTMAPELPRALELIRRLDQRGVVVSMGHTNATYDEARFGFEFGARHTTHTYNAMRPLHHRDAGTVGYALWQEGLACELIYDRKHVSREAAAILIRNKPQDKIIGISDCTMAAGMPSGTVFEMWGLRCVTGKGEVRLEENGALAGSAATLYDVFRNLCEDFGPEVAIRACCVNPRLALGLNSPPRVYLELDKDLKIVARRVLRS